MRILQINALYGSKSTGGIVKDIHKALLGEGIDSRVVCVRASERELGVTELGYGIDGRLHALMTRLNGKQGFYSGIKTKRLLRELEKDKPDIIHIHNLHSNFINLPGLFEFAARNGIPVMMTLHDAWYFTGKCYHFLDNGCDRWQSGCYGCPKKNRDIPSILDKSSWVFEKKKRMYSY
jgi:glycosyltransferase involved in cell wall biosynthesis